MRELFFLLLVSAIILLIISLLDIFQRNGDRRKRYKILWFLIVLFFPVIGPIFYLRVIKNFNKILE